jgi:hypothetical protein
MRTRLFSSVIKKTNKICITCKNYKPYSYTYPIDEIYDSKKQLGTCSLFGTQNIVTGEIENEEAFVCRNIESKCGKEGRHYTQI